MSSPVTASDSSSPAPLEDIKPISTSTALSSEVESRSRARTAKTKKATAPTVGASRAKRTATTRKAKTSITGKTTMTKATKKAAASKAAASGRPSWKDIIRECIIANKEDARVGVSRTTIKKVSCLCVRC